MALNTLLVQTREGVQVALCDDIDTPKVLRLLRELSGSAQQAVVHLENTGNPTGAGFPLLGNIARFIRSTLHDLG
ncbi:hypothetical protein T484DRAFT_1915186, partial [Baffinella frigidus]